MKRLITSFALAMLAMLGASGIAYADQSVSCANVNTVTLNQFTVIGDSNTACSITTAISASASIEILGSTITDTMPISNSAGNILMISQGAITTSGTITETGTNFNIDIKANQGGNGNLTIGSGGISKIVATQTGGGVTSIIYVTNGTSSSTGTLTLSATSAISVPDGSGDYIILNAQMGNLSMPAGTLSTTGNSGRAGSIQLLATTVNFAGNATLTAAQAASQGYSNHGIAIAATTINYAGTLTVTADGNGGFNFLFAQGGTTISDTGDYKNLTIIVTNTSPVAKPLTLAGGSGLLKVTANGTSGYLQVAAYPISFTGGAVTLQAQGTASGSSSISISNLSQTGGTGLTFGGTGTVLIDASGNAGNGGYLYVSAAQAVVSAPTLTLNASGPSSGSGNGGTLYFQTTKTTLSGATVSILNNGSATGTGNAGSYTQFYSSGAVQLPTTTFKMSANGSSGGAGNGGPLSFQGSSTTVPAGLKSTITANGGGSGTGNGGAITMYPVSNITLGNNAGQFAVAATSGSTGGNGGSISIEPFGSTLTVANTATPISVSVLGATGNGGSITLEANTLTFNGTSSQLTANAGSTSGNGGSITLSASSTALTIGTGSSGNVQLYAKAPGNGNGGSISVTDYTGITVNSADLSVLAGTTGNGNGGTIALTGGPANLTGSFNANSSGNGTGGTINFQNGYFTFNGTQSLTASGMGTGQGGTITLNQTYSGEASPLTLGANTTLIANSASGPGGTINITSASQPIAITGSGIFVAAATTSGSGAGGTINVTATSNTITVTGTLNANGSGTGLGGQITLTGNSTYSILLNNATISASAASNGNGSGNVISIRNSNGGVNLDGTKLSAQGYGNGSGGNIAITASTLSMNATIFNALANAGTGAGGNIDIIITGSNPVDVSQALFNANASPSSTSAAGGTVSINLAEGSGGTNPIDILAPGFNVSAGSAADQSVFDGSISLNTNAIGAAIVCTQIKNQSTVWPTQYWYCGHTPANSQVVLNALQALSPISLSTLSNGGPYVLVFFDVDESDEFLASTENAENEDTKDPVAAWYSSTENRINVMENLEQSLVVLSLSANQITEASHHEAGHVLDIDWGSLAGEPFVSQIGGTEPQSYGDFVNHDFRNLTYAAPSYTTQLPACGTGAIFQGKNDPRTGSPICPLQGDLVGLNNQQILQTILPYFLTTTGQRWKETWAQEIAVFSVSTPVDTTDFYFLNYFPCTQTYVTTLYNTGAIAALSAYPTACTN